MPESRELVLQAFLVLPVQRIPRYKLLLEDLLRHTPETHIDYSDLKRSIVLISEVATFFNETIRKHELMLETLELQKNIIGLKEVIHCSQKNLLKPGRLMLKRGIVQKICRKSHQPRVLFLFSDILIYASASIIENRYQFCKIFPLETCKVEKITANCTFGLIQTQKQASR
jgi:hypothetical protein